MSNTRIAIKTLQRQARDRAIPNMFPLLNMDEIHFPADFLFGAATAGYQIEGNNATSNIYNDELNQPQNYPCRSGNCCDFWNRYAADIDLFGKLGFQIFRMSIEWSRIEPEHGHHDERALARYLDILESLNRRGIKVSVTLHHWSHPQWFEDLGAFRKRENIHYFLEHIEYLAPRIKDYVYNWTILNEFTNYGALCRGFDLMKNLTVAHAYGYRTLKQFSDAPASSTHAVLPWDPQKYHDKMDTLAAAVRDWMTNEFFIRAIATGEMLLPYTDGECIPELKDSLDYWALNYYTRHIATAQTATMTGKRHGFAHCRTIDMPFYLEEFAPEGLLRELPRYTGKPIYICENGCCADDDRFRLVYLAQHLQAIHEAMEQGCDIQGYMYWAAMDNYEWGSFIPRFGLIGVDFDTLERTIRPSAGFYAEIIKEHGISTSMRDRWLKPLCDFKTYPLN